MCAFSCPFLLGQVLNLQFISKPARPRREELKKTGTKNFRQGWLLRKFAKGGQKEKVRSQRWHIARVRCGQNKNLGPAWPRGSIPGPPRKAGGASPWRSERAGVVGWCGLGLGSGPPPPYAEGLRVGWVAARQRWRPGLAICMRTDLSHFPFLSVWSQKGKGGGLGLAGFGLVGAAWRWHRLWPLRRLAFARACLEGLFRRRGPRGGQPLRARMTRAP